MIFLVGLKNHAKAHTILLFFDGPKTTGLKKQRPTKKMQSLNGVPTRRRCCEDMPWIMIAVWLVLGLVTLLMFGLFFVLVAIIVARQ